MKKVLEKAKQAFEKGEVPVAAAVVYQDKIIALTSNQMEQEQRATAHAELLAIEKASKVLGDWRLKGCTLYVSLEPCVMCMGAIMQARMDRVVWGASDKRLGGGGSWLNVAKNHPMHQIKCSQGLFEKESSVLLKQFFQKRRQENHD